MAHESPGAAAAHAAAPWIALRGAHPLVAYVDLKSPYAFIAVEPTRAVARAVGVTVDWRPFTLDIPSYLGSARLGADGATVVQSERTPQQWSRVRYSYMDARRYAALAGRTLRGTVKIWDSSRAGIAMLWAKNQGCLDRFLDEAYPPFWRRELDIEDTAVLERVLRAAGADTAGFAAFLHGDGRAEHDAINESAFAAGVFGVPTYLAGDEMWFGREHLPRIAWLLAGARGAAPDVANRSFAPAATTAPTGEGARRVEVLLDLRDPASYLALQPAAALGRELGVAIDWLPLATRPLNPPSAAHADDDRGTRHRRLRAQAIAREIDVYARAQGLVIREIHRDADAGAFTLGWLWLRRSAPERLYAFLEAGFRAYWACALDAGSVPAVADLVAAAGGDARAFAAWCASGGPDDARRLAAELHERGLFGTPAYVVAGEHFLGRQHLPMIRWILGGRVGPGPI